MNELDNKIALVKDNAVREALVLIARELKRIRSVHPTNEDTKSIAHAINAITGKL